MKILLVEDNPGDILLAKEALKINSPQPNSYELLVQSDGENALNYLFDQVKEGQVDRPDLILLDLNLPRKNGLEVLKALKADPFLKTIPVIVFSTSASEADISTSYSYHANCYITKPVDFNDFVTVMGSILCYWREALPPSPLRLAA
ncbi:MAG: response regulator [Bacteroidota bacterium]